MTPWIPIPKPTETSVFSMSADAEPIGFLIAITSFTGTMTTSVVSGWGDVPKPTSSVWTFVPKPLP